MAKNVGLGKSGRKPFRDISNCRLGLSKSTKKNKARTESDNRVESGDSLDRLLLAHSDISNLLHQIDELVVRAVKAEGTSKQGRNEVESFTHVLSEMISSLKPWVPRLQKAFSIPSIESEKQSGQCLAKKTSKTVNIVEELGVQSPEPTKGDFLVSPSPLVSWRANDCAAEMGKQLFALTPLPRAKTATTRSQVLAKSVAPQRFTFTSISTATDKPGGQLKDPTPNDDLAHVAKKIKPTVEVKHVSPALTTPCLKMSPMKSCTVLEPSCGGSHRNLDRFRKSTPFPIGKQKSDEMLEFECSSSEAPCKTSLKNPVLKSMYGVNGGKKALDASPTWIMSPPKTCILMDPSDKPMKDESEALSGAFKQHVSLASSKKDDTKARQSLKHRNNPVGTPMCKEPQSTAYKGKLPGENTLKRELWVRFEAASNTNELNLNSMVAGKRDRRGFLDMLEEAS